MSFFVFSLLNDVAIFPSETRPDGKKEGKREGGKGGGKEGRERGRRVKRW